MAPESDQPGSDLPESLAAIRAEVLDANPQLYRHVALYLQVLRETLPRRLEQACFHLATRSLAGRYVAMAESDRRHLHQRLSSLIRQCTSLLTVEQLACLAAQMAREEGRRRRLAQRRLLERLSTGVELVDAASEPDSEATPSPPAAEGGLSFPLPIPFRLRLGDRPDREAAAAEPDEPAVTGQEPLDPEPGDSAGGMADPGPWEQGRLPSDPIVLLRWLEGMDQALQRRLRNLSHAVNVELLRAGLCPTLLPVSLLDAALHGRVDSAPAPPHLLVLPLPFQLPGLPTGLPAMAVLLRRADLELEEPRLRTCRRRLQQHRQELRRMADHFRRLQRRLETHQAERLWLQDHPAQAPQAE